MKMSALTVETNNRKLGYVSQRSKKATLKDLVAHKLITDLEQKTSILWFFNVDENPRTITQVESKLRAAHVAYRKES